jgi:hypothetical protein
MDEWRTLGVPRPAELRVFPLPREGLEKCGEVGVQYRRHDSRLGAPETRKVPRRVDENINTGTRAIMSY